MLGSPVENGYRPEYTRGSSSQTLRAGLEEYYRENPGLLDPQRMDAAAAALFRSHDAAHVVFGCDTTLRGETLIDLWTIFASTIGLRGYLAYLRLPQVQALFAEVGLVQIAIELARCTPDALRVIARSRRLSAKWPWDDYRAHLDERLADLRRSFHIRVLSGD